jgi:hypothetical protein
VIDCDTCTVRGAACGDCVVSVMLGGPPPAVAPEDERALEVLAGMGMVPPLQMRAPEPSGPEPPGDSWLPRRMPPRPPRPPHQTHPPHPSHLSRAPHPPRAQRPPGPPGPSPRPPRAAPA